MKPCTGDQVISFVLPSLDGSPWSLDEILGKPFLLSFFRFSSCPFCNLRLHYLTEASARLPDDFLIIAVFESPLQDLQRYAVKHASPFPILADEGGVIHGQYGVEHSWKGVLKGMMMRLPSLLYAMFVRGYFPLSVKGKLNTMPADFLVDSSGVIQHCYYGNDEGDHMPLSMIESFAKNNSRTN